MDAIAPLRRENDCIQLLNVLVDHDGEPWPLRIVAEEAGMPQTTTRRLLYPEVWERRPYAWFVSLREAANLSVRNLAAEYTTRLVESYYGQLLANFTYLGVVGGRELVRVNTSQFAVFQRIGAKYDFDVTFDSTLGRCGHGLRGRARARYVGPTFRWSHEDSLEPEGYRVRWDE